MLTARQDRPGISRTFALACVLVGAAVWAPVLGAQEQALPGQLQGFDGYMEKILKDWNAPGVAVGVVAKDKLVFAKGYGYRDFAQKLPMTPQTLFQIASNTKLFTAVAVGMLVDEGKLDWDRPIRQFVPSIQFYNDELNNTVTIRDMLAHRTGITRHDSLSGDRMLRRIGPVLSVLMRSHA
jgi:CubicO group peptidase (beta-lactamase class C family)